MPTLLHQLISWRNPTAFLLTTSCAGHRDPLAPGNKMQGHLELHRSHCTLHPSQCKAGDTSGPAEIAHLFFLAKRLSVLSCCIRIAAGCWAILTAFKWGQQQVQNAKEGISCLSPRKHRAELHWHFTFTWTRQTHVKHSALKPILPKHIGVEVCSVPWTNSTSSFTWFFFSSLGGHHLCISPLSESL